MVLIKCVLKEVGNYEKGMNKGMGSDMSLVASLCTD